MELDRNPAGAWRCIIIGNGMFRYNVRPEISFQVSVNIKRGIESSFKEYNGCGRMLKQTPQQQLL
jgi:hypothetical protein